MPRRLGLLAVPFALLAFAPAAHAGEVTIGSDLAPDATIAYSDGNDWSAWNTSLPSDGAVVSPVSGEVNLVRLKGFMKLEGRAQLPPKPGVVMHAMVLRPQDDGSVRVVAGGVSEDLPLPLAQDPAKINTYTRSELTKPDGPDGKGGTRLCIQKGDYLAFTTSGGFGGYAQDNPEQIYVNGAQFQVFGTSRATSMFHNQGGAYDFDPFKGRRYAGRELLMNATIGTGADARYTCRTDAEKAQNLDARPAAPAGPGRPGVSQAVIVRPARAPKVRGGRVRIALRCPGPNVCAGTVALRTYTQGAQSFSLPSGRQAVVTVVLNAAARRKLTRRGAGLTVKVMVTHLDGSHATRRFVIRRS